MLEPQAAITAPVPSGSVPTGKKLFNYSIYCENRDGDMSLSNIANRASAPIENEGILGF